MSDMPGLTRAAQQFIDDMTAVGAEAVKRAMEPARRGA